MKNFPDNGEIILNMITQAKNVKEPFEKVNAFLLESLMRINSGIE